MNTRQRTEGNPIRQISMRCDYEIEEIPGKPIILAVLSGAFDPARDTADSIDQVTAALDTQPTPVFYTIDIRALHINFGDMVRMMGLATKGTAGFLKHPNIREVIIITSSDMFAMGAQALGQKQYGGLPVSVFGSPEEAFTT